MSRYLVVATADQHVNSTVGLCPPAVTLDDGGTYRASELQLLQWSYWKEVSDGSPALWPPCPRSCAIVTITLGI